MNKLTIHILYRIFAILLCIIHLPLCGMKSSRVADIYSVQQPQVKKCSCFAWLFRQKATPPAQDTPVLPFHSSCETPICQQLKSALRAGDIETVAEHLTPDNVNLTMQVRDYHGETHTANLLEFVLYWNTYTSTSFKLQFIELLIKNGFEHTLLDTILATDDIELVEQFVETPEARRPSECNVRTPLALFMYQERQSPRSLKRKTAHHAALKFAGNAHLDPELRARFTLIAQTLAYQSLTEVVTNEDVKLLKELEQYYPEIVQAPVFISDHSMSIADYAESLFDHGIIRSQTFTVLEDFLGPRLSQLPNLIDDKPVSQKYQSDGNIHYHSQSIDLELNVTAPDDQASPVTPPQDQTFLHIDQKTSAR